MTAREWARLALLWPLAILTAALLLTAQLGHRHTHR